MIGVGSEIGDIPQNVCENPDNDDLETDAFPIVSEDEASQDTKLNAIVDDLAKEFKPVVSDIESGIKTTQNNYGRYLSLLSQLSDGNKNKSQIFALALIKAGANRAGVSSALKVGGFLD